ncbi:MAG: redoxin domain-containing protein [Anaerolineales bacterium]|nr:redoxin domain-containing protein [Anaerolineales bacterium]
MSGHLLEPRIVRMPEFAPGEWLHVERPLTRSALRGQVVLVDFWDYTCINCIRTLPYLVQWQQRYADKGLTIIGIHAPEFKFAQFRTHLEKAIDAFQLTYPILLDNGYENWSRFANKAWPTKYVVDGDGYIRFRRRGEGYYLETEQAIQQLLRQRDPQVALPDLLPPLRDEDAPGAVCYRPTPELYAGYQGGGLFGGGLGNVSGYLPDRAIMYQLSDAVEREDGRFYLDGFWRAWPESVAFAGRRGGQVVVPYTAVSVNAVLAPSADTVETALEIRPSDDAPIIEVQQDGHFLTPQSAGADVQFLPDGTSFVTVSHPRMYELVNNPGYEAHELTLSFQATGLAVYAFTFTSCVISPPDGR